MKAWETPMPDPVVLVAHPGTSRASRRASGQRSDQAERVLRAEALWHVKARRVRQSKPGPDMHERAVRRHLRRVQSLGTVVERPAGYGAKHHREALARHAATVPTERRQRPPVTPMQPLVRVLNYQAQNGFRLLTVAQSRAVRKAERRDLARDMKTSR